MAITISTISNQLKNMGIFIKPAELNDFLEELGWIEGGAGNRSVTDLGKKVGIHSDLAKNSKGQIYEKIRYDETSARIVVEAVVQHTGDGTLVIGESKSEKNQFDDSNVTSSDDNNSAYVIKRVENHPAGLNNTRNCSKELLENHPNSVVLLKGNDEYWTFDDCATTLADLMHHKAWKNKSGKIGFNVKFQDLDKAKELLQQNKKDFIIRDEKETVLYANLLSVAITRARKIAWISYYGEPSEYIAVLCDT